MDDEAFRHAFCKSDDGSWTCIAPTELETPNGRIQVAAGTTFFPGTTSMGFDLAAWLDERLHHTADKRK